MKVIHKFPINDNALEIPHGGRIIHAGRDPHGVPCVWAEVDPEIRNAKQNFLVLGTGREVPPGWAHAASFNDGPFMWHVYHQEI